MLGGSRSGKSRFAESLLSDADAVDYVATAAEHGADAEWTARIAAHRALRPTHWTTLETFDVAAVLLGGGPPVLVESITLWLAHALERGDVDGGGVDALCAAWEQTGRRVVAVSDEVGSGVVPETATGRRFRDALGLLNQRLAETADEVHLVVAGIPVRLR